MLERADRRASRRKLAVQQNTKISSTGTIHEAAKTTGKEITKQIRNKTQQAVKITYRKIPTSSVYMKTKNRILRLDKIKTEIIDPENETDSARLGKRKIRCSSCEPKPTQQQFVQIVKTQGKYESNKTNAKMIFSLKIEQGLYHYESHCTPSLI
jgi:hypothetical protein